MSIRLYDLTEELHALLDQADAPDTDGLAVEISEQIEICNQKIEEKLENYAAVVRELDATEKALKEEKSRFDARMKSVRSTKERLKGILTSALFHVKQDSKGVHRVRGQRFHLYLANNPPSIDTENCNLAEIPDEFVDYEPKIRSRDILTNLKATGEIPAGVILKPATKSVRIR